MLSQDLFGHETGALDADAVAHALNAPDQDAAVAGHFHAQVRCTQRAARHVQSFVVASLVGGVDFLALSMPVPCRGHTREQNRRTA